MSYPYDLGVKIEDVVSETEIERLNSISRAYQTETFDKDIVNQYYKNAVFYFKKHARSWNPPGDRHEKYVNPNRIYSLKNDWDKIASWIYSKENTMIEQDKTLDIYILHPENIAVRIRNNKEELSRIVQRLFNDKGYFWGDKQEYFKTHLGYIVIQHGKMCQTDLGAGEKIIYTKIDLTKVSLSDLITIFNNPVPPPALEIHRYKAEKYVKYSDNNGAITFGCATIAINLLRDVYRWMDVHGHGCNRTISSITLGDSGKALIKEQVKQILGWFDKQPINR